MLRRNVLLSALLLAGCGRATKTPGDMLPGELQGWKRGEITAVASLPAGAVSGAESSYTGQGRVNVRVIQYNAETVAFEKMQQWRQSDGLAAYKGPFFFIAQPGEGASVQGAMTLLAALKDQGSR